MVTVLLLLTAEHQEDSGEKGQARRCFRNGTSGVENRKIFFCGQADLIQVSGSSPGHPRPHENACPCLG